MKDFKFERTATQISNKVKLLKKQYKEEVDKLRRSGVGLDSDDEDEIFVNFKWFFDLHRVMKKRAIVRPPALLESSSSTSSRCDSIQ